MNLNLVGIKAMNEHSAISGKLKAGETIVPGDMVLFDNTSQAWRKAIMSDIAAGSIRPGACGFALGYEKDSKIYRLSNTTLPGVTADTEGPNYIAILRLGIPADIHIPCKKVTGGKTPAGFPNITPTQAETLIVGDPLIAVLHDVNYLSLKKYTPAARGTIAEVPVFVIGYVSEDIVVGDDVQQLKFTTAGAGWITQTASA